MTHWPPQADDGAMTGIQRDRTKTNGGGERPRLQPRWFIVGFWYAHRALLRATRGRLGLWRPKPDGWGTLWLTTTGRRSGQPRQVVLGYVEHGGNLVTMAMNGWGAAEPAWWLNLQAHPDATVRTRDGVRQVHARRAQDSSGSGSGHVGPRSTRTSTGTPHCDRPKQPSLCSGRRTPEAHRATVSNSRTGGPAREVQGSAKPVLVQLVQTD